MKASLRLFAFLFTLNLVSCKPVPVSHWFVVTPLEHYEKELYEDKLEKTQAGQTWFRVSREVLSDSLFSIVPYQERFYLGDSVPAQSVRLIIPEGRKLVISPTKAQTDSASKLFLELYRIKSNQKPKRIDYLKNDEQVLTYSAQTSDTLLLRMQTGLNEKLAISISITTQPLFTFPVANHDMSNVISIWGVERDRGTRSHEGIDISAKRGTPAIAASDGLVTQVGTNNLGGKVVFLSANGSPYSLYYAHLDSQLVSTGTRISRGDTLGLVGNTGNAITTKPHLHFGIYVQGSGAIDPLSFINNRKEKIPGLAEISKWFGDTVKIRKKTNLFTSSQFLVSEKINSLSQNTILRILGETSRGYRVVLPSGIKGYIPSVPLERANSVLRQ